MSAQFAVREEALRAEGTSSQPESQGCLIVNADDWGRDEATTDRIRECFEAQALSSASAMVFMKDSERAAVIARQRDFDCGLHLNLTTPFSGSTLPPRLAEQQRKIAQYLKGNRLAQVFFHPGLASPFRDVVAAQIEEYVRLYGAEPERIDGHHHMHLCANVLLGKLLPEGTIVRRNFSFPPGEKSGINRWYRGRIDRAVARRHRLTDFFFSLPPLEPSQRLDRMFALASQSVVEIESHPVNTEEYEFLAGGEIFRRTGGLPLAPRYRASSRISGRAA